MFERNKLSMEELREYYKNHRKYTYHKNDKIKNLKLKKALYPLLKSTFSLKRNLIGQKLTLINENTDTKKSNRPIIFAVNHNGKYDIEIVAEALNEHAYILMGDPEQLYRTVEGLFLSLNGVVYLEVNDKDDCEVAKKTIIKLLKNNANVMWYPEGIWNLDKNLIVLPFKFGIIDAALQSNALIVPVGLEQRGKEFYVSIGQCFDVNNYKEKYENSKQMYINCCNKLRDLMASELWKIWEHLGVEKRKDIPEDYYENFINERIEEWPQFTFEELMDRVYKKPGVVELEEIKESLQKVKVNKNNAFLLNKRHFY